MTTATKTTRATIERENTECRKYDQTCDRVTFTVRTREGKEVLFVWAEQSAFDRNCWGVYRWDRLVGQVLMGGSMTRSEAIVRAEEFAENVRAGLI